MLRRPPRSTRTPLLPYATLFRSLASEAAPARARASARVLRLGRFQRVLPQRGHGHRPHPARHRGDPAGPLPGLGEDDVAYQAAVVEPVDTDLEHHRARLPPVDGDPPGAGDGHTHEAGLATPPGP